MSWKGIPGGLAGAEVVNCQSHQGRLTEGWWEVERKISEKLTYAWAWYFAVVVVVAVVAVVLDLYEQLQQWFMSSVYYNLYVANYIIHAGM